MPRSRLIDVNIGHNYRVAALPYAPHDAQKFFTWMIVKADCEGRLPADPKLLNKIVAPLCDYSPEEVDEWLGLMEAQKDDETGHGLIERYQVKGHKYLWIPGWENHQPEHLRKKETPSNIPPPPTTKERKTPHKPAAKPRLEDVILTTNFESETLPDWINKETWESFLEMRKEKKAIPTERAIKLLVKELEKLRGEGHDPNEVLNQSIMNSWKGVFPLKGGQSGTHRQPTAKELRDSIERPLR